MLDLLDQANAIFGARLAADRLLLGFQIAALVAVIVKELWRRRDRNLYAILIASTLLMLVQGQAWWLFDKFEVEGSPLRHLFQLVSLDGARLANLYLTISMLSFLVSYMLTRGRKQQDSDMHPLRVQRRAQLPSYVLILIWTLGSAALLILVSGGITAAVTQPGRLIAGQTLLLVAIALGKLPLLDAMSQGRKGGITAVVLFSWTLVLVLLNSRLLAVLMLLQLGLLFNYRRHEVSRAQLAGLAVAILGITFVFGLYRQFQASYMGEGLDRISDVSRFRPVQSHEDALDWFYGSNVEGFVGVAGILSEELRHGGLDHDFGLSTLAVFTQLVPNTLRTNPSLPFAGISDALASAYPYQNGSIVSPGFEVAYAHFALPGMLLLATSLGYLARRMHSTLTGQRAEHLVVGLLSVEVVFMVRGTLVYAIFFSLADLTIWRMYRWIIRITSEPMNAPLDDNVAARRELSTSSGRSGSLTLSMATGRSNWKTPR